MGLAAAAARLSFLALVCAILPAAQLPQNPSPMVEHTRAHPRLAEERPAGRREPLELGTLFLPEGKPRGGAPLLVFFHGGTWLPEVAGERRGIAVWHAQIGHGSGVYARAFATRGRFLKIVAEAAGKAGRPFGSIALGGWSAGCGAVREILQDPEAYARVNAVLCIDGMHTGYVGGKPGPQESDLETAPLAVWKKLGEDAAAGRKRFLLTHSEIFPGTFASTTETADWLVRALGLRRRPVLRWGPMGTQQLSEIRRGGLTILGFAGNSAPDHVDQLHSLTEYLRFLE